MPATMFTPEVAHAALQTARALKFWKIFLRMLFVILKVKGYSNEMIADILSISKKTVCVWQRTLRDEGLEALATLHYKGQPSKLNAYGEQLALELDDKPVATLKEARTRIEKATGIARSVSQVRAFLQRIKIKRRKVGQIPDKADLKAQARFKEEKLEPLIQQALVGRIRLFFLDASHFVHLPFLGHWYSLKRKFIRSASGRKRFNVLGALDALTHQVVTVCNDTYITAGTVCELLERLAIQHAHETICVVLDNARYQRCAFVEATAARLGIHLEFLTPYSPHFNVIERLWRFVKKEVLYNEFYATFDAFRAAVKTCLEKIASGEYRDDLASLLTLRFQNFDELQTNP